MSEMRTRVVAKRDDAEGLPYLKLPSWGGSALYYMRFHDCGHFCGYAANIGCCECDRIAKGFTVCEVCRERRALDGSTNQPTA